MDSELVVEMVDDPTDDSANREAIEQPYLDK